jgi:hypothetical protein
MRDEFKKFIWLKFHTCTTFIDNISKKKKLNVVENQRTIAFIEMIVNICLMTTIDEMLLIILNNVVIGLNL